MKRKILMLALLTAVFALLLSVGAAAADEYDLWVNGVQVTSDNADDVLNNGTVSYDAATNILTLDGAELDTANTLPSSQIGRTGVIYAQNTGELTINVIGDSTITANDSNACGIYLGTIATQDNPAPSSSLVLTGTARLDINVGSNAISATTDITIQGLTLNADVVGYGNAVSAGGKVVIKDNADVTLKSNANYSSAIACDGGAEISNAKTNIICTGIESNAIYSNPGDVIISDGAYVEASSYYPALYGYTGVKITDSTVKAHSEADVAIYSGEDLTISNSIVEAINDDPYYYSIAAWESIDIDYSWFSSNNGAFIVTIYNSVQIEDGKMSIYGDAVLPGDVTISEGQVLVIREGESLTIPKGVTLTNYGTIQVLGGSFTNNGIYMDYGETLGEIQGSGDFPNNWFVTVKSGNGAEDMVYRVVKGKAFTLPDAPGNSGYIFLGWRCGDVTYKAGEAVDITSDTTFTVVWGNLPDVDPEEPEEPEVPDFPFYDVNIRDWYYDAVYYVWDKGLMDGVDTHEFAPNATLTRAMVWTIIARAEGVDTTGGNSWYAKAQEWVVAKGISDGENPSAAITRQELVTMLYRLAGEPAVSGTITAPDAASVSAWASDAMVWAMNIGLIEGDENGAVTPTATATRAQAAAIFMRYIES